MKNKAYLLFLISVIFCPSLFGQEIEIEWERTYSVGDSLHDSVEVILTPIALFETEDNGFIVATRYDRWRRDLDIQVYMTWIFKTDSEGNIEWEFFHENYDNFNRVYPQDVLKLRSGEYLLLTHDFRYVENERLVQLASVLFTDDGEFIWQRTYPTDFNFYRGISNVTEEGNIMIIGHCTDFNFIYILDDSCDSLTFSEFYRDENSNRRYSLNDICQIDENQFFLTGSKRLTESNRFNIILMEINAQGDSIRFQEYDLGDEKYGKAIRQTRNGEIITGGTDNIWDGNRTQRDVLLAKFDFDWNSIWYQSYGREGEDYFHDMFVLPDGRITFIGALRIDAYFGWLQTINSDGDSLDGFVMDEPTMFREGQIVDDGESIVILGYPIGVFTSIWLGKLSIPPLGIESGTPTLNPISFSVNPAFPNPFNSSTNLVFTVGKPTNIEINVINTAGQLIFQQPEIMYETGVHRFCWNIQDNFGLLPSGGYTVVFKSNINTQNAKVFLVK